MIFRSRALPFPPSFRKGICVTIYGREMMKTKAKELLKILQADGWQVVRINGSHHILKHPTKPGMPIIPMHNKDLRIGTYKTILKQAGFDQES